MMNCQVDGCTQKVSKADHLFCLQHWKAERNGEIARYQTCQRWHDTGRPLCLPCYRAKTAPNAAADESPDTDSPNGYLSSTRIGEHFKLPNVKVNLILAELGWIEK